MNNNELAQRIYREIYGDIDSKSFKTDRVGEIEEWLDEGDGDYGDFAALVTDWREYNTDSE